MFNDNQGSSDIFGLFSYTVSAANVAARADTTARRQIADETKPAANTTSMVKSAYGALRSMVASITAKSEIVNTA